MTRRSAEVIFIPSAKFKSAPKKRKRARARRAAPLRTYELLVNGAGGDMPLRFRIKCARRPGLLKPIAGLVSHIKTDGKWSAYTAGAISCEWVSALWEVPVE